MSSDDPRERLLAAAVRCAARSGVQRFSLEEVAAEAGLSRATLYRQFPGGREQLVQEAAIWEVARFWTRVAAGVEAEATLEDRLTKGIVIGAEMIRRSAIMASLGEDEVAELATALRPSEPLVHEVIRSYLRGLLERESANGGLAPNVDLTEAADYLTRMVLSVLSAPAGRDLTDASATRALVRTQFLGGIAASP
ncbi:MAG: TetR/AcrR family transcriptional regulator [Actinomycetes bacterium]